MNVVTVIPFHGAPLERLSRSVRSALETPGVDGVLCVGDGGPDLVSPGDLWASLDIPPAEVATTDVGLLHGSGDGRLVIYLPDWIDRRGLAAALNAGISLVEDDTLICRLDVGDAFFPELKGRQIESALNNTMFKTPSFAGHHNAVTGATYLPNGKLWHVGIFAGNQFSASTTVFHRRVWTEVGRYDESLAEAYDWDFAMRVQYRMGWRFFYDVTGDTDSFHVGGIDPYIDPYGATPDEIGRVLARGRKYSDALMPSLPRP